MKYLHNQRNDMSKKGFSASTTQADTVAIYCLVTADNFQTPENLNHLYQHFRQNGMIHPIPCGDKDLLKYTGRDIQRMIAESDETWKTLVPEQAHQSAPQ